MGKAGLEAGGLQVEDGLAALGQITVVGRHKRRARENAVDIKRIAKNRILRKHALKRKLNGRGLRRIVRARPRRIYKGIGVQTIDADVTSKKRSTTVTYHVKMQTNAGIITYNNRTDFVKENHRYRIDWDDSVIFPQLGAEDKVRVKTLYAKRGRIKDAQGNALAVQGKIYSVGFVPGKMDGNSVKLAAKKLGLSKEEIQKKLDQKWVTDDSFVPLIKLKEYSEDLLDVKGIIVSTETGRIYPLGEAAAHLIGYMQNGEGKAGLEKLYDEQLSGTNGLEIYIEDSNGQKKQSLAVRSQTDGKDLTTTINSSLQKAIYEQYKNDKSAHVALNPSTGEVKALV